MNEYQIIEDSNGYYIELENGQIIEANDDRELEILLENIERK